MHRQILEITDRHLYGDHINHDTLNNQRNNLRIVTMQQNNINRSSKIGSTSKYLGVHQEQKCFGYIAAIKSNGKVKKLGTFKNEINAAKAYNKAALIYHKEYANLNIINK